MNVNTNVLSVVGAGAALLALPACQKEAMLDEQLPGSSLEATELVTSRANAEGIDLAGGPRGLVTYIDAAYNPAGDYYVVTGVAADGDVDTYYGRNPEWTKIQDKFDAGASTKGQVLEVVYAADGTFNYFFEAGGVVQSNGGFTIKQTGAPKFNSGGRKIGDLVEFIDAVYNPAGDYYVVSGVAADGSVDTYFGSNANWTKVQDKFGAGASTKGQLIEQVYADDGTFTYFFEAQGKVQANRGFTIKATGAPKFNSGGSKIGTLVEFIDADYNSEGEYFVVTGIAADGGVDTYFGQKNAWTKIQDKYDAGVSAKGQVIEFVYDDAGKFNFFFEFQGAIQSNAGYTIRQTGAPRFNEGGRDVK